MFENVDYSADARKEGVKLDWTSEEERIRDGNVGQPLLRHNKHSGICDN